MKLFYLFPDPTSRTSIAQPGHRYGGQASLWYGMDQANRFGHTVDADLYHRSKRTRIENVIDRLINNIWSAMGGSGGNWFHILALRKPLARADLIISTADRVGIPLVLLMAVGLVPSRPILYMSIGLPERWDKMRAPMRRLYRWAFQKTVSHIVCYGYEESQRLQDILANDSLKVHFLPFGVDTSLFQPRPTSSQGPITSIGADPHRDFDLLVEVAQRRSEPFLIITSAAHAQKLRDRWSELPPNITLKTDVPFADIPSFIANARAIVLPLHNNSYSGATTTLLQCMAMEKPVVVTRTGAIKHGYFLTDQDNVLFIPPEDPDALTHAIDRIVGSPDEAQTMARRGHETILAHLTWDHYLERLFSLMETTPLR
ncbi:MAG: glycosyltransferase family 4 protein [Patescibacteria group bacterium]